MPRDGALTREKILDVAFALVLERGFAGTSVDAVLEGAGITKGAFFHHFPTKHALALALVERYARLDAEHYDATLARALAVTDEPVQQVLVLLGLWIDGLREGPNTEGCLYASFCYENGLLDDSTRGTVAEGLEYTRRGLSELFERAVQSRPPRIATEPRDLADQVLVAFEGGLVMSRSLDDPDLLPQALERVRDHVRLLFDA